MEKATEDDIRAEREGRGTRNRAFSPNRKQRQKREERKRDVEKSVEEEKRGKKTAQENVPTLRVRNNEEIKPYSKRDFFFWHVEIQKDFQRTSRCGEVVYLQNSTLLA